jgi:arylsulfotransferase ASST
MSRLRTSVLFRSCATAAASVALLVPLASTAGAAEAQQPYPAVVPLGATETTDLITLPTPLQTPALVLYDLARGVHVLLDQSFNEIATIAMRDQPADVHDIEFSPDGSRVLVQGWASTPYDLSPWGGSANATVLNPVIQEQIVATGEVTFEWSALDHVSPDETTESLTSGVGDIFHSNSLEYDDDGNILSSFRNASTVYKIDIATGDIIWRFGGEQSDFSFPGGQGDMPSYQHGGRRLPNGQLSVFDNGNARSPQESRGAAYTLDESAMTATLASDLRAEPPAFSPYIGTAAAPDVVVGDADADGGRTLHVSWNGATEVDSWRIEAGPSEDDLATLGVTPKPGFETAAEIFAPENADVLRVTALDEAGQSLDSRTITAS